MDLIRLRIKEISYSQTQTGAFALILEEAKGNRKLPIIIGNFEAQSIALALDEEVNPPRPLTHDLFVTFSKQFNLDVKSVDIYKLKDGVFYSYLHCFSSETGKEVALDSRTSDAIAIGVRFGAPIYVRKSVMDKAGIILEISESERASSEDLDGSALAEIEVELLSELTEDEFTPYNLVELGQQLKKAVGEEDYHLAAQIRDEIVKRK